MRTQGPPTPRKRRATNHDQSVKIDPTPEQVAKIPRPMAQPSGSRTAEILIRVD